MRQTFTKDERLHKKILIGQLFRQGSHFFVYPFRVTYLITSFPEKSPAQVLISVPKQHIRKAFKRNRIKRLMRETFRKNKNILYKSLEEKQLQMVFCLSYTNKEILSYDKIHEKIIVILQRLSEVYAENIG